MIAITTLALSLRAKQGYQRRLIGAPFWLQGPSWAAALNLDAQQGQRRTFSAATFTNKAKSAVAGYFIPDWDLESRRTLSLLVSEGHTGE